ncbi:uncharacterized protein SCHCODRAFT_02751316 [Schizophyllum commune H4-8]|nr:uncharacterized protein SCHCODRAFT_02751316 [Schizophyllum commune H4-8]KAI5888110.1 hypothetical protein SCHCODRAFT_02751316 [Schizophyllum commune H4-8]
MSHPLKTPEIVTIIMDFVMEDGYDRAIWSACHVNKLWEAVAHPRLWSDVDLTAVLMRLPEDAWHIYTDNRAPARRRAIGTKCDASTQTDEWNHSSKGVPHPTFAFRRPIANDEWMSILPFTRLVRNLRTIGGPTNSDTLRSRWGHLALHARTVYDVIADSIPDFCLFPNLRSLDVEDFGTDALVMFAGPELRSLRTGTDIDNMDAAECIEAFVDEATDTCPFVELHIANALALELRDEKGSAALEDALLACRALERLTIDHLHSIQWRTVAVLPHLVELHISNGREFKHEDQDDDDSDDDDDADLGFPSPDEIDGPAFPSLRALSFVDSPQLLETMSIRQLRLLLEMREDKWPLERLVIPSHTIYLRWKHRVRTVHALLANHIDAETLQHLVIGTMYGPVRADPFPNIKPLFAFYNLTVLHLFAEFDRGDCESPPLDPDEAATIARRFPHLRDLLLCAKFPLSKLPAFAQYCPDLEKLQFTPWVDEDEVDSGGSLLFDPPAFTSSKLQTVILNTFWVTMAPDGACRFKLELKSIFRYARRVFPDAALREYDGDPDEMEDIETDLEGSEDDSEDPSDDSEQDMVE